MEYIPSLGLSIFVFFIAAYFYQKYQPPPKPSIVGIDLGTTYSSIATFHSVTGQIDIYDIENGSKSVPSQIYYEHSGNVHVGYAAQSKAINDAENLIYDGKRFIGKNFTDKELDHLKQYYSFDLQNINGKTFFKLTHKRHRPCDNDPEGFVSPECVASLILAKLVKTASSIIKRTITKAVIAVPADFNESQEKATIRAAKLAGISILRVITEPTAAALSYGLHHKQDVDFVLVVDVGGGTTDVSLLRLQGGMFYVHGLSGNNRLGGQDFNDRLLEHLESEIGARYGTEWHLSRREDLQALKMEVERAKLHVCLPAESSGGGDLPTPNPYKLSSELHLHQTVAGGGGGGNIRKEVFEYDISLQLFNAVNRATYQKIIQTISVCLDGAGIQVADVDEVVLVGGSTRIPSLRTVVAEFFGRVDGTGLHYSPEPELAVVKGVAVMAGIVGGAWPLTLSAIEPPPGPDGTRTKRYRKIQVV